MFSILDNFENLVETLIFIVFFKVIKIFCLVHDSSLFAKNLVLLTNLISLNKFWKIKPSIKEKSVFVFLRTKPIVLEISKKL